jgi:glycosyltransferase involved in cell wall biosynthesis
MLVSILINNYNYAPFVAAAIGSALAQTWRPLEVVVVDDGSTDDSWSVITTFGRRIRAIRQRNAGQGAAYNTGFAASHGEWVLFLDSDDMLDPDAVQRMLAVATPQVAKVQGYLRRVGPNGERLGGMVPFLMHDGDVRPIARRFRQYAGPPGSGNLFRRSAIRAYFPMPAKPWRYSADTVPVLLSCFHGRVATAAGPVGSYRLHTEVNNRSGVLGNVGRSLSAALLQADVRRRAAEEWGSRCTGIRWTHRRPWLPWDWRTRVLSWRLRRDEHPYPNDTRRSIWRGLSESLASWPGYGPLERLALRSWMAFMLLAPQAWVEATASSSASSGLRTIFKRQREEGMA